VELKYIKLEFYLELEFRQIKNPGRELCLLKKKHVNGTRVYKT